MKLSKRELIGILVVVMALLAIGCYKFVIQPQREAVETLKTERESKRAELLKLKEDIASESQLFIEIAKLKSDIEEKAKKFFTNVTQEDIILLLNDFSKESKVKMPSITFPQIRVETIPDIPNENQETPEGEEPAGIDLEVYSANISYEGYYYTFLDLLKRVSEYDKKIIIKDMNVSKGSDGYLTGNLSLDFYTIGNIVDIDESLYVWAPNFGSAIGDPFLEFNDYLASKETSSGGGSKDSQKTDEKSDMDTILDSLLDKIEGLYGDGGVEGKVAFDFEDIDSVFFIGNHRDIKGKLRLEKERIVQGQHSINLEYDFLEEREHSVANVSFDNNVIIRQQPRSLALSVYPIERNNCSLGVIIRDREGHNYKLPLTQNLDWRGWQTLVVDLPTDINYPAVIERVYVESFDYYEKLTGNILIDNLQLLYDK